MSMNVLLALLMILLGLTILYSKMLYYGILRAVNNRKWRARKADLFEINPRKGRILHLRRFDKLRWTLALNQEANVNEIKEYAEVMGIDNSGTHIDTVIVAQTCHFQKWLRIVKTLHATLHQGIRYFQESTTQHLNRIRTSIQVMLRSVPISIRIEIVATIKFVQNTGGAKNDQESSEHNNQV